MAFDPYGLWYGQPILVIDFETTGVGHNDRVIEIGLARFEHGALVASWGSLIKPPRDIPLEATRVHGISDFDVMDAPAFVQALPHVIRLAVGAQPAAYNATFDRRFWMTEVNRLSIHGIPLPIFDPTVHWIDPLVWVRRIESMRGGNKLEQACARWSVETSPRHRAKEDAVAAGQLLFALVRHIPNVTMTELLRQQEQLHENQEKDIALWTTKP